MPACGKCARLGFAVPDDASGNQLRIVEHRAIGMGQGITEFAPFMDGARRFRPRVTGNAIGPGELPKQLAQAIAIALYVRKSLGIRTFKISARHQTRPAMAWAGDQYHVQIILADEPIEMGVYEVQSRRRTPMAQQARLDVIELEGLFEKRIVLQIDLSDRQIICRSPIPVDIGQDIGVGRWFFHGIRFTFPAASLKPPWQRPGCVRSIPGPRNVPYCRVIIDNIVSLIFSPNKQISQRPRSIMTAQSIAKLEIRNLRKAFGANLVLNGLNLSVETGKTTVIVGPSGGGKSVLAKCILGLLSIDGGEIFLDGTEITHLPGRKREEMLREFGVLFQRGALFDSMTVWRNVAFGLIEGRGIDRATARATALENLAKVGLGLDVADLLPAELSGGMQKRVALARAIAAAPTSLLLDGPTDGLDPIMAAVVDEFIVKTSSELRATTLAITNNLACVRKIANRVAVLQDGKITWQGKIESLDDSGNSYVERLIRSSSL